MATAQERANRRIEIIEGLGFTMTNEAKAHELKISQDADERARQAAEAAEIMDWLEIPISRQMAHTTTDRDPFPEGCGNDYDDLRNFAIGR